MKKICLVEFDRFQNNQPVGSLATFEELINALLHSLLDIGYQVNYKKNQLDPDSMNILIGVHRLFYSFENINFKENYFVLNLEPLDEKIYQKESQDTILRFSRYLNFLKKSNVIDYSYSNIKILNKFHSNTELFKFGFFNFNKNHLKTTPNNLYLFYGNCGDRRTKIFTKLINEDKLPINILHNIWGLYRDHEILNSRGIINIHRLDNVPLEIYRIWHSLCLGKKILSEQGADKKLDNDFTDYIFFTKDPNKITSNDLKKTDSKQNYNNTSFKKNLSDLLRKVDI